jgi:hypothetical protein
LYSIKNGKCLEKDGSSTRTVGKSNAVHVSQGEFNGEESYAILYSNGEVYMTTGSSTKRMMSNLNSEITSTVFYDDGLVFNHENGKQFFRNKNSGKTL